MKKEKPKPLRRQLSQSLLITFGLLWMYIVALLINSEIKTVEGTVDLARMGARESLEEHWSYYENNLERGLGAEAEHILAHNLSSASLGRLNPMDGGIAFLVRDRNGSVFTSQIAWGYGHEDGIDTGQRWYLYFDEGLDRQGQKEFAQWMVDHRQGWEYSLYPSDSPAFHNRPAPENADGTYARVTGVELPGFAVSVQKIELVHTDGTTETMVETNTRGEQIITLELRHMQVKSVLLPSWGTSGDGPINMNRRLDNFLAAQNRLQDVLNGKHVSVWSGITEEDRAAVRYIYGECQVLPYVLRTNWILYLQLFLLTVAAALILSSHLSKKVTLPTEELCRQAETGKCSEDGPVSELNLLAAAFNIAQTQLEGQIQRERDFTRAAAHELKTPLTVIRTHAEFLQEDMESAKRKEYLSVLIDETDRMAALTGSLLELSRLESGISLHCEPLELSALTEAVFHRLDLPMKQKELSVSMKFQEAWVNGDRERLQEAVGNLAANALRYCPNGKAIRVTIVQEKDSVSLIVYNEGSFISDQDLEHLWEPFYRGDKSRNRESGGSGLGLAIVRAVVLAHGGRCSVANEESGVSFKIMIPSIVPQKM